jgi:hypothetical protein
MTLAFYGILQPTNHSAAAAALGRVKSDGFGLSVCLLRRCQFIEIRDGD